MAALEPSAALSSYPFSIDVPSFEFARGTLGMRHVIYTVEFDDCGRKQRIPRRFSNVAWLHAELKKQHLACALPELPPKKSIGNLDQVFVERRRQALEGYLRALLREPAVVKDNAVWAFLDADEQAASGPRFVCRPPFTSSPQLTRSIMAGLMKTVSKEGHMFRACVPVVLSSLVAFAEEMATVSERSAMQPEVAPGTVSQDRQVRQECLTCFFTTLRHLTRHETARQGLLDEGVFGALLKLLGKLATEVQVCAQNNQREAEAFETVLKDCLDCLQTLLEHSDGGALLHFCQHHDGLGELRRFALAEGASLPTAWDAALSSSVRLRLQQARHPMAASILWLGLQHLSVVDALVGGSKRGLQLIGDLLVSNDLCAKVLASLCMASVLREDSGLAHDDLRLRCLDALDQGVAQDLDEAEEEAANRAARETLAVEVAVLEDGSSAPSFAMELPGGAPGVPTSLSCPLAPCRQLPVVELLRKLCFGKELRRLLHLMRLPNSDSIELDEVTAVVLALLDHFAVQNGKEPQRLAQLTDLVPTLHHIVEVTAVHSHHDPSEVAQTRQAARQLKLQIDHLRERHGQDTQEVVEMRQQLRQYRAMLRMEEVHQHAASILVRAADAVGYAPSTTRHGIADRGQSSASLLSNLTSSSSTQESETAFQRRTRVLEATRRKAETMQAEAAARIDKTGVYGSKQVEQDARIAKHGLDQDPCLHEGRLLEVGRKITLLGEQRRDVATRASQSQKAREQLGAGLDQRRTKHVAFVTDLRELSRAADVHKLEAMRHHEAASVLRAAEERMQEADAEASAMKLELAKTEVATDERKRKAGELEARYLALDAAQQEAGELVITAPSQVAQLMVRLTELEAERGSVQERVRGLEEEKIEVRRHMTDLERWNTEARKALETCKHVDKALTEFHQTLHSETILTDAETNRLREFAHQLQPALPSRLRQDSGGGGTMDGGGDSNATLKAVKERSESVVPEWDDAGAEQDFLAKPNYRTFFTFCNARRRLWEIEAHWVKDVVKREEGRANSVIEEINKKVSEDSEQCRHEEHLRQEIAMLDDHEGHVERHRAARQAAEEASEVLQDARTLFTEADVQRQQLEVQLQERVKVLDQAHEEVISARKAEQEEAETAKRSRDEMQRRTVDLEGRMRCALQEEMLCDMQQRKLRLLQEHVDGSLVQESTQRRELRAEVHKLIEELHELDRQLEVPPAEDIAGGMEQPEAM
eukprot:TRINITY_DN100763_c0_g1_i1.p1 TRINITY_DN100763_c0_g1~~TRINITY_DN100763_c0_g1_i1.p1  ORF type:complete len:1221 (+),score=387.55 TRINITY_DN100763_c0_g1_i1:125-3787(+)